MLFFEQVSVKEPHFLNFFEDFGAILLFFTSPPVPLSQPFLRLPSGNGLLHRGYFMYCGALFLQPFGFAQANAQETVCSIGANLCSSVLCFDH